MTQKKEAPKGTEVALPKDWQAELAAQAGESASNVRPASSTISLKAGIVTYQGIAAPDNQLDIIIIDFAQEHTFYKAKYDADNISSPDCYAVAHSSVELEDMVPADNVPEPESDHCLGCPMLKWGSSLTGGRGKACQQRYRLIAIPASSCESGDAILAAEAAIIKLPVTSGKIWSQYIGTVASLHKRPEWSVVTRLSAKPDAKTQFKATFEMQALIDFEHTPELYKALQDKKGLVQDALLNGYDLSGDSEQAAPDKDAKHAQ